MERREAIAEVVRQWVRKAEEDLKTANQLIELGRECSPDVVCFHAQQAVEKCLKALLTYEQIVFPKSHDVERLVALLPESQRPDLALDEQRRLTIYATVTRYPGDYEPVLLTQAQQATTVA